MSSTSETGHGKNVANFELLTQKCVGFGDRYNPTRDLLKKTTLDSVIKGGNLAMKNVASAKARYSKAVGARQEVFGPLGTFSTRVKGALAGTEVSKKLLGNVETINRKIQGARADRSVLKVEEIDLDGLGTMEEKKRRASVSQQSFSAMADHWGELVEVVDADGGFNPNELDLQIEKLRELEKALKGANTDVGAALTDWELAIIQRDQFLYNEENGLVEISKDVKKYVKSVFGADSGEFKLVSGISFKDLSLKKAKKRVVINNS